jgi:DTW domain-containing protein YfiP
MTDKFMEAPEPPETTSSCDPSWIKASEAKTALRHEMDTCNSNTSKGATAVLVQASHEALIRPSPEALSAVKNSSSKQKRPICGTCHRPTPKACICSGLPVSRISLQSCHILVLQHPHEKRRKNCSLPLLQLCLADDSMTVVVSRRLGDQVDPKAMALLEQHANVLLIFPAQQEDAEYLMDRTNDSNRQNDNREALSLSKAREHCRSTGDDEKALIVILDATWKYAREMDKANVIQGQYPRNMRRVALSWDDPLRPNEAVVPCRFDIRTPPSQVHLSTAECIAWVVSALEEQDTTLYATLMKPLDVMVAKWHDCRRNATGDHNNGTNNKGKDSRDGQHQRQSEGDDDYRYDSNPSHTPMTDNKQGRGETPSMSRTAFFTMGDVEADGANKQYKSGKRRWNK